jgi:hypothetical protein
VTSQLDLFPPPTIQVTDPPRRWSLTRPMQTSRLRDAALRKLEGVRAHFPELDAVTIKVGRTQSRRAQAWASLDPEAPQVWIKPGALKRFTIAHEFVHLLQARELAPRGEKSADLYALARHADLIDERPAYLEVPQRLFSSAGAPRPGVASFLQGAAAGAIRSAKGKPRRAIRLFESAVQRSESPGAHAVG